MSEWDSGHFKQRDGGALERRGKRRQLAVLDPGKLNGVDMRSDPPSPEDRVNPCVLETVWGVFLTAVHLTSIMIHQDKRLYYPSL